MIAFPTVGIVPEDSQLLEQHRAAHCIILLFTVVLSGDLLCVTDEKSQGSESLSNLSQVSQPSSAGVVFEPCL